MEDKAARLIVRHGVKKVKNKKKDKLKQIEIGQQEMMNRQGGKSKD